MSLNAFGCPLSTRERHIRLVGEARFKRSPGNEEHPSCGIWPKASYTNHSCYSNARRAFIGDMMIVRATQDLEPNTEITMWYRPPLSNDIKGQLADFQHWGFECTCVLCQDIRATDKDTLAKRKQLTARLRKFFKQRHDPDAAKVEAALTDLESTYTRPATEVPRLCFWDPALALSCMYESHKQPLKAIEWGMKSLTALGYVVEGGSIPRSSDAPLVIKKWGLMEDEVVGGWIILSRAYRLVAPELEAAAREYAKICYRICVGEEETFEETYAVPLA